MYGFAISGRSAILIESVRSAIIWILTSGSEAFDGITHATAIDHTVIIKICFILYRLINILWGNFQNRIHENPCYIDRFLRILL